MPVGVYQKLGESPARCSALASVHVSSERGWGKSITIRNISYSEEAKDDFHFLAGKAKRVASSNSHSQPMFSRLERTHKHLCRDALESIMGDQCLKAQWLESNCLFNTLQYLIHQLISRLAFQSED